MDTMENTTQPNTASSGSGKKIGLIIVVVVILLLLVGGFIIKKVIGAVGNKVVEKAIEKSAGNGTDVDFSNGTYKATDKNGNTVSIGGNAQLPSDWPSDVPQYPGSKLTFSGSNSGSNGKAAMGIVMTTSDSPDKVAAYYRDQLTNDGWVVKANSSAQGASSLAFEKGDRAAIVIVADGEGTTNVTVSVGEK